MIAPMKKYSFLVFHKDYEGFLEKLRTLGVVQIQEIADPKSIEQIQSIGKEYRKLSDLLLRLERIKGTLSSSSAIHSEVRIPYNPDEYIQAIESTDRKIKKNEEETQQLEREKAELSSWGEFDPQLLSLLKENGYKIDFWNIATKQYDSTWEDDYNAVVITQDKRNTSFVTVCSSDSEINLPADHIAPPLKNLSALLKRLEHLQEEREYLQESLGAFAQDTTPLERKLLELKNQYNWGNVFHQGERIFDEKLIILEGWIPSQIAEDFERSLDEDQVAYTELSIKEGDKVPIILKNNFFVKAFEPIVKMFSLPNYFELDPTPFVAPFFMLFFAMCFGDAGYGLFVLLFCTFYKRRTTKESLKPLLSLFQWLGGAAVIIGFFSGSFFGIELAKVEALAWIRHYFISPNNMMIISIAVGIIQIIVGRFVAAYKIKMQRGVKYSLSSFAWTIFIIAMLSLFLLGLPQLRFELPQWLEYSLYGIAGLCVLIIVFYNSPGKNIFYNIGNSLWKAYNTASGLLGDTLSYIRLFAIGLTGAILGSVFNTLAFQMTETLPGYIRWLPILLILVIGHSINFGLTMIGALVHPIRLIFVEYFNNSEYEGGGKEYKPFKEEASAIENI